ncbi:MAG: CAP domain-containing protein [Bacteroidia bacterium]|jgi:uncharacterized protein YkwD|nr:CAP domain-containing protein [Bacteroidia bacterium]
MKFLVTLILYCACIHSVQAQQSLRFEVTDQLRIRGVLKQSVTDSVMKTERLAALRFHRLINEYRRENKLDTLAFNDTLWLAARNHNIWMMANDYMGHTEEKETPSFTGEDPGDRYEFVVNGNGNCLWTGENCLYNFASGSTVESAAENIATASFSQWKSSPGHNANMLRDRHWQHGVAFSIGKDGRCWGTDLFTNKPYYAAQPANTASATDTGNPQEEKRKKFVQPQALAGLKDELYKGSGESLLSEHLQEAAQQHADYLVVNRKDFSHTQKEGKRNYVAETPEARFKKAGGMKAKKLLKKYSLKESIASASYHVDDFEASQAAAELIMLLNSEQKGSGTGNFVGFGVTLKRSKNVVTVYVVRVELVEKDG